MPAGGGQATAGSAAGRPDFEAVVSEHYPALYRFVYRLCLGNRQDAEDLCQEAFLRAYRAFGRLDAEANHRAWLFRIAYNLYLNHRRDRRPAVMLDDTVADRGPTPGDGHETSELVQAVAAFLRTLPPKQRAALVLRRLEGREYDEIAGILGCSEESARANLYQAVKKVRDRFGEEYRTL